MRMLLPLAILAILVITTLTAFAVIAPFLLAGAYLTFEVMNLNLIKPQQRSFELSPDERRRLRELSGKLNRLKGTAPAPLSRPDAPPVRQDGFYDERYRGGRALNQWLALHRAELQRLQNEVSTLEWTPWQRRNRWITIRTTATGLRSAIFVYFVAFCIGTLLLDLGTESVFSDISLVMRDFGPYVPLSLGALALCTAIGITHASIVNRKLEKKIPHVATSHF